MRPYRLPVLSVAFLALGFAGLAGLRSGPLSPRRWSGTPTADGELVFRADIGAGGRPIPYAGGLPMLTRSPACHADRGQGGRVQAMMRTAAAPNITWLELTAAQHENGEAHPPYAEAALSRAITTGIDPAGALLAPLMPRRRLGNQEWQALLACLRTLR